MKQAALDRVDEAREVEGVDRSEMLRRILGLGLAAWESAKR